MSNYTNFSDQPHTLTIRDRKTKELVLTKKFETEGLAVSYMNAERDALHELSAEDIPSNKKNFSFLITGPNTYYYQA